MFVLRSGRRQEHVHRDPIPTSPVSLTMYNILIVALFEELLRLSVGVLGAFQGLLERALDFNYRHGLFFSEKN